MTISIQQFADSFEKQCRDLIKVAYIRKLPNGKWVVKSRKGKILGTYDTKQKAVKKLRQIEFFKHKKASIIDDNYSATMRSLNKKEDQEKMKAFQKAFKQSFDEAYLAGKDQPETIAFENALQTVAYEDQWLVKKAAEIIPLGADVQYVGRYLANLIKFLLRRISQERRQKSIDSLKRKIFYLNEYSISGKKTPASSAMGQSLTLLKHILIGHNPAYIRNVLNAIVSFL